MSIPILRVRNLQNTGNIRTSNVEIQQSGRFNGLSMKRGTFTTLTSPNISVKFYTFTNPESAIEFNDTDVEGITNVSGLTVSNDLSISGNLSVVGNYIGPTNYNALDFVNLDISFLRCVSGILNDSSVNHLVILDNTPISNPSSIFRGSLNVNEKVQLFENLHISGNLTMITGQLLYQLPEFNVTDISTVGLSANILNITEFTDISRSIISTRIEAISNELLNIYSNENGNGELRIEANDISVHECMTILPGGFVIITQEENVSGVVGVYRELDVSVHSLDVSEFMEVQGDLSFFTPISFYSISSPSNFVPRTFGLSLSADSLDGYSINPINPLTLETTSLSGDLLLTNHIYQSEDVSLSSTNLFTTSISKQGSGLIGVNISSETITISNEGRFDNVYLNTSIETFSIEGSFQVNTLNASGDNVDFCFNLLTISNCSVNERGLFEYITTENIFTNTALFNDISTIHLSVSGLQTNDISFSDLSTIGLVFNNFISSGDVFFGNITGGNFPTPLIDFTKKYHTVSGGTLIVQISTLIQNDAIFSHPQGYIESGTINVQGDVLHFETLYNLSNVDISQLILETSLTVSNGRFNDVEISICGDISSIQTNDISSTNTRYFSISADTFLLDRLQTDILRTNELRVLNENTPPNSLVVDRFQIYQWEISNDQSSKFQYDNSYVDITYNNTIIDGNYFYFNRNEAGDGVVYPTVDFSANRIIIDGGIFYKTSDNDGGFIDETGIFTQSTLSGAYTLSNETIGELVTTRYNVPRLVSLDGSGIMMGDSSIFSGTDLTYTPDYLRFTTFLSSNAPGGYPTFAITNITNEFNCDICFGMTGISTDYLNFGNTFGITPNSLIIDLSTARIYLEEYPDYPDIVGDYQKIFPNYIPVLPSPPNPPPFPPLDGKYQIDISGQIDISLGYNSILGASNELTVSCQNVMIGFRGGSQFTIGSKQLYNVSAIFTGDVTCDTSNLLPIFSFTGSHPIFEWYGPSLESLETIGRCVCSYGYHPSLKPIHIHEAPILIGFTTKSNDNRVYGVLNDSGGVNSIGEGSIWVIGEGGNIQNGDWLTSSSVPGYAMKQSVPYKTSYTIGKALEPIDFSSSSGSGMGEGTLYRQFTSKKVDNSGNDVSEETSPSHIAYFIGCTYHCG
jgi:hypothetical protein